VLRDHWKRQAQDRLKAGPEWKDTDNYVFRTAWGEPVHPDTVSSLMTALIKSHNDRHPDSALPHARLHDLRHVHATTCFWPVPRCMSSPPGSATPTLRSPCGCTPM
jgi:integrase